MERVSTKEIAIHPRGKTSPPGFRRLEFEYHCGNCESYQCAPMIGGFCERFENRYVTAGVEICDCWEPQVTDRKQYLTSLRGEQSVKICERTVQREDF